jgi:hypothetical protein
MAAHSARTVILVEGISDQIAVETVAARRGLDADANDPDTILTRAAGSSGCAGPRPERGHAGHHYHLPR